MSTFLLKYLMLPLATFAGLLGTIHVSALLAGSWHTFIIETELSTHRHLKSTWQGFKDDMARNSGYERTPESYSKDDIKDVAWSVAVANGDNDPQTFVCMLTVESGLNPDSISSRGALGIGQVMPDNVKKKCGLTYAKAFQVKEGIECAHKIHRENLSRVAGNRNKALSLYNWGKLPGKDGKMPTETINYIQKVNQCRA